MTLLDISTEMRAHEAELSTVHLTELFSVGEVMCWPSHTHVQVTLPTKQLPSMPFVCAHAW